MNTPLPSNATLHQLLALPVTEKLNLIGALWDSIDQATATIPIPAWQLKELERREAEERASPDESLPWEEVKQRLRDANAQTRPS